MPSTRKINAAACTPDDQPLLFSVTTNYCGTKCPPEKFIPVYYFFRAARPGRRIQAGVWFY